MTGEITREQMLDRLHNGPFTPIQQAYRDGVRDGKLSAHRELSERNKQPRIRIPRLSSDTVSAYIGAVARAARIGAITSAQANSMLYAAQLMVSAQRTAPHPPPHQPFAVATATKSRKK